jgi:hypothetical protein
MSTNHPHAVALIGWSNGHFASIFPRTPFLDRLGPDVVATSLFKIRKFFKSIDDRWTKSRRMRGGPGEPPEDPALDTLWDDPALWVLMLQH